MAANEEPVAALPADVDALSVKAALTAPAHTGYMLTAGALFLWIGRNRYLRAPWYYQMPHFTAVAGATFAVGYLSDVYRRNKARVRAAYVEDFKRAHPDLYPESRRLRWGEVLDPWSPRR